MNIETNIRSDDRFNYDLMAAALRYIEARAGAQPSLEEVAAAIGLSPAHFQRVFSRWVGVSPKRYLQYLTLDHAKRLLKERFTVLDATYEAGLSSPGRLHDLFVRWEAMTPGEFARDGAGLTIRWGWFETPFGEALAKLTADKTEQLVRGRWAAQADSGLVAAEALRRVGYLEALADVAERARQIETELNQ